MNYYILGNICSLLAMGSDAVSSSRKTAKGVLIAQSVSQLFYGASTLFLKGYSALVQNVISLIRNLFAISGKTQKSLEWLLIVLGVVLGLLFNNRGAVGLLPVIGNLEYSLAVFRFRDNERALKTAFLINIFLFAIFNVAIFNFVGAASNVALFIMTAAFLVKDVKRAKQETEAKE